VSAGVEADAPAAGVEGVQEVLDVAPRDPEGGVGVDGLGSGGRYCEPVEMRSWLAWKARERTGRRRCIWPQRREHRRLRGERGVTCELGPGGGGQRVAAAGLLLSLPR